MTGRRSFPGRLTGAALVAGLLAGPVHVVFPPAARPQASTPAPTGWFAAKQAEQGRLLFNNYCAECHRPDLSGAQGPALKGAAFLQHWTGQPLSSLYGFEHANMPANAPDSLPDKTLLPITAFILQRNGYAAGNEPLDAATLARTLTQP